MCKTVNYKDLSQRNLKRYFNCKREIIRSGEALGIIIVENGRDAQVRKHIPLIFPLFSLEAICYLCVRDVCKNRRLVIVSLSVGYAQSL